MYRTIEHFEDSVYKEGAPSWTMDLTDVLHIQLWGGNYGACSCGIYKERESDSYYYITDMGHGQYNRMHIPQLDNKHISEVARDAKTIIFKNLVKQDG